MAPVSIAIIGLHGSLGKPTLDAINSGVFDDKLKFPIKALTRNDNNPSTDKIEYIKTEINSETIDSISSALSGVDVIVELITPNPELFTALEKVAEKVKPKLYIPSQFGSDIDDVRKLIPGFLTVKTQHTENLRNLGIKTVDIVTNYFAQPGSFLYEFVTHIGIDPATNSVVQIGSLDTKSPFTRVEDIGKVVLAVATTPIDKLPNKLKVKSGSVTYKEFIERYESSHNVVLTIKEKLTTEEAKKQLDERLKESGGFNFKDFTFYLHVAGALGLEYDGKDNELINPNESIWKWQKY
ncbi:hypothetical protein JA1_000689 [Spathaspora sp. JA1]|nr:hypothetical protein JA1_000689 [Spathaspora sp. JA1]